jgi:biopolymer transport protein TolR
VLIIIFMVITPLTPRGLPTAIPQPPAVGPDSAKPSSDVVVTVREDGTLLLNREPVDLASLRTRLEHLYQNSASRVIFVRGERAVQFGTVAEVIDTARGAGVYHVGLMAN